MFTSNIPINFDTHAIQFVVQHIDVNDNEMTRMLSLRRGLSGRSDVKVARNHDRAATWRRTGTCYKCAILALFRYYFS